jgi:hypothetical protein
MVLDGVWQYSSRTNLTPPQHPICMTCTTPNHHPIKYSARLRLGGKGCAQANPVKLSFSQSVYAFSSHKKKKKKTNTDMYLS